MAITFGSLFAGAGGMDMGLEAAGLRCVWQVECDPTANAVRRRHWPHVDHVRDVAGFSRVPRRFGLWLDRWQRPDVICGGFPCQDVSVAGKRGGLEAGRTGLWWQMLRIITGMRPRYVVWENVPGLLSSDGGRDFQRVVDSLAERGYFGCVRTLDAQHFGVPQRRRRLFGVFASGRFGAERCCEILALTHGVQGRNSACRETPEGVAGTLGTNSGTGRCVEPEHVIAHTLTAGGFDASDDGTGRGTPLATCLTRREGRGPNSDATNGNLVEAREGVRRLTPRECERLMGWPDDWTRWDDRGRQLKDSPRYRLCGNGVAKPVAEWIGQRIVTSLNQ